MRGSDVFSRVDRRLYSSIVITAACLLGAFFDLRFGNEMPWWHCSLYHFDHANVFHLALNLWGLYTFRPRWSTCAVAYISSTLAALIPFVAYVPTCGLSGFLMAAYARRYASKRLPIWKPLLVNIVFAFIPVFNWKIHVVSFLISYVIWRIRLK